jgi:5'(3')-deoxyribonucleotidase
MQPGTNAAKVLYIDMDNVLVDFTSAFPHIPPDTLQAYDDRPDDIPGIFSLMAPMPGALQAFERLAARFDTYILSTAPWGNPSAWKDKVEWVQRHLGEAAERRLILTHHKNLNRGDYLIDDRTARGAGEFEGELILFGSPEFPDWAAVLAYLEARTVD